jgi:GDP-mannose 4,6-dehydratase
MGEIKMRVLITGITGFVASHLAEFLINQKIEGLEIYGTRRWRSPNDNIKHIKNKINFVDMELNDFLSVKSAIKESQPDLVFHLAAQSFVPAGTSQPKSTIDTNVIGTLNILEAVRLNNLDPRIQVVSTADVYANVSKEGILVDEKVLPRPPNLYSVSKYAAECVALQYHDSYGMKTIVSRMLTHTGPRRGVAFVESDFAKQIAEIESSLRDPIINVGNLDSVRTFLDVRDAVNAYWQLINKCNPGEIYNICGNTTITIKELLDRLITLSSKSKKIEVKVDKKRFRPNDLFRPGLKIDKFKKATGWKPEIKFEQTLKDLLDYWREEVK